MIGSWTQTHTGLIVPEAALPPPRPKALDLFAGVGGFSLGLVSGGIDVVGAVEADPDAALTYLHNLGAYPVALHFVTPDDRDLLERRLKLQQQRADRQGTGTVMVSGGARGGRPVAAGYDGVGHFWFGDIRQITGAEILDALGMERGELDLIVGGPPCQGFSVAGRRNVMDPRSSLVFEWARLVVEIRPRCCVMENVPGIMSMVTERGAPVLEEVAAILERGRYCDHEAALRMLGADPGKRMVRHRPVMRQRACGEQVGLFSEVTHG